MKPANFSWISSRTRRKTARRARLIALYRSRVLEAPVSVLAVTSSFVTRRGYYLVHGFPHLAYNLASDSLETKDL